MTLCNNTASRTAIGTHNRRQATRLRHAQTIAKSAVPLLPRFIKHANNKKGKPRRAPDNKVRLCFDVLG